MIRHFTNSATHSYSSFFFVWINNFRGGEMEQYVAAAMSGGLADSEPGRRAVIGVGLALAGVAITGCGLLDSRYRLRMTVETAREKGASVLEIGGGKRMKLTSEERSGEVYLKGEAVRIDLADGPVFALLTITGDFHPRLEPAISEALAPEFRKPAFGFDHFKALAALSRSGDGDRSADLSSENWPLLVRFLDIQTPQSVEKVEPQAIGVRRVHLETTSAPITRGLKNTLPWLGSHPRFFKEARNPRTGHLMPAPPGMIAPLLKEYQFSTEL
jgi:hypothetical protein